MDNKDRGEGGNPRESTISRLLNLCRFRQDTISDLRVKLRDNFRDALRIAESVYVKRASEDADLSYVVIAGSGKIVASTETFREKFHFNDTEYPIEGKAYFKVLKAPPESQDYAFNIKKLFRNPRREKLQITICDGEGVERFVYLTKYEPFVLPVYKPQGMGKVGKDYYFYTRVDVYDIGVVERELGRVKRLLHLRDGEPLTVSELMEKRAIKEVKEEGDKEKDKIISGVPKEKAKDRKKKK